MAAEINKTVDLNAPLERVWQALTDHEQFGEWFCVRMDGPFVPGETATGRLTYPGYEGMLWEAEIVALDEPNYFSYRWHPYAVDPNVDYSKEEPTLVEFRLEVIASGTRLTVTETGFDKLPGPRMPEAMRMNEGGWEEQLQNVKAYVEP